ncbi:hypothetical protein [Maribacter hydrothermalis]|uniref:Uncharacterized protein n=1 Tax=Maribacter hydrothermalis TaxID=1836467 RepID=A0A1B7Z482_9FLAO|nr:hypothetical protein [Maribacter hydrothermalis]APQ17256.1 hypothetical protein BTR34_07905 [Maribacter hydrothermalis]OBR37515.1 hypothetical protein A9200_07655 [Maribacter hydrothermalis]
MKEFILEILFIFFFSACTSDNSTNDLKPECLNTYAEETMMNSDENLYTKISKYRAIDGSTQYWATNDKGGIILNENCEEICTYASMGVVGFSLCPEGTTQAEFIEDIWQR